MNNTERERVRRVAVIGGTSESVFICKLLENKCKLYVFVATEDGRRIMDGIRCTVHVGRLDIDGFCSAFENTACVVDASHPFASEVSSNVRRVCGLLNISYIRYIREKTEYTGGNVIYVTDKEAAVEILNRERGRVLFTTGAKTARFYENNVNDFNERAVMRVMDSEFSHRQCDGMSCEMIFTDPPFSAEDNIEIIKKYSIDMMLSKDSEACGGVPEKAEGCKVCGIPLILINAPDEKGTYDADEVVRFVCESIEKYKGNL